MKNILILTLVVVCSHAYSQDTLYVKFTENRTCSIIKGFKHKMDTLDSYPFDGGRMYVVSKKSAYGIDDKLRFTFFSYTPKWMDNQFEYDVVDSCMFRKKEFKDAAWFDSKTGSEIVEMFAHKDVVIYLVDETEITDKKKIYMVRVYFSYTSPE